MTRVHICGIDGYLGFPLAMKLAADKNKNYEVSGSDNFSRRKNVRLAGSDSAIPILDMERRLESFEKQTGEKITFYEGDLTEPSFTNLIIKKERPHVIVHLGEIPSAPYSMVDLEHCNHTQMNNIISTNNILFAMKKYAANRCHLVKLGCYSDDTEVLTKDGWKNFEDLKYSDEVCCLNPETEEIIYHNPTHIVKYPYKGKMMSIKTQNMNFLITPNHRIIYRYVGQQYKNNAGPIHIKQAKEIFGKNFSIPKTGIWQGEETDHFEVPEMFVRHHFGRYHMGAAQTFKMDDWLRFFGWYIAEGCIRYRTGEPTAVYISQKTDSNNTSEIRKVIQNLNLNAYEVIRKYENKSKTNMTVFQVSNNRLAKYLEQFGKSGDKYIPKELKNLGTRQLSILFDALIKGDGHIAKKTGSIYYYSKSERLLDDVQEIAMKLGYGATICTYEKGERKEKYICFSKHPNAVARRQSQSWVPYEGFVYCCTVPTGIIMVRRNGKSAFSGNTLGEFGTPPIDIPEAAVSEFPRSPASFYHNSKVFDSINIEFACKIWGLRSTDIMQGVVYGSTTEEIEKYELHTRYDTDSQFGTCLNRFCAQAVIGHPLTVYGTGGQTRGYIALRDSLQCMKIAIDNPPKRGEYRVFNQYDEYYSVNELAEMVKSISRGFGLSPEIEHLENPRVEAEEHYYNPVHDKLKALGFKPTLSIGDEIALTLPKLMQNSDIIRNNIDAIRPDVLWREAN